MTQPPFAERICAQIDLSAFRSNLLQIRSRSQGCGVMAVLKANGYGLGAAPLASAAAEAGVERLGVAALSEAQELRKKTGLPIQLIGSIADYEIEELIESNFTVSITSAESALAIAQSALKLGRKALVHIHIDTGMGRLGIPWHSENIEDLAEIGQVRPSSLDVIERFCRLPGLAVEGISSHFSCADKQEPSYTQLQCRRFLRVFSLLSERFRLVHIANSDALFSCPDALAPPFNMVRSGIALYGTAPPASEREAGFAPVLTLKGRILEVRRLAKGARVGYGGEYVLKKDSTIATIGAGYADGIPFALGGRGRVIVNGRSFPIVGRISMDYTTIDFGNASVARGSEALFIGGEGENRIWIAELAKLKGTHPYDILCSLGDRVKRYYIE